MIPLNYRDTAYLKIFDKPLISVGGLPIVSLAEDSRTLLVDFD